MRDYLHSVISKALNKNILRSSLITKQIINIFRERKIIKIPITELETMGLLLDNPNKVFHEVQISRRWFVEPSSPALSLIISENIKDDDGIYEFLDKLFKKN